MLYSIIKVKTAILLISNIIDFNNIKMKPSSHKKMLKKNFFSPNQVKQCPPSNPYYE